MIRIGLVGEKWIHEYLYPAFFNGVTEKYLERPNDWFRQMLGPELPKPDERMRITGVWSGGDDRGMIKTWDLPVYDSIEALAKEVDAAILLEKDGGRHLELARPFIERGLPVYVDKPFTSTVKDAEALVKLTEKHGAAVFAGSALRQTKEMAEAKAAGLGAGPKVVYSYGIGEYNEYSAHPIELGLDALQERIVKATRRQVGTTWVWDAEGDKGSRLFVQLVTQGAFPAYKAIVCGDNGMQEIVIQDLAAAFATMERLIKEMFITRKSPMPLQALVDPIRLLDAPIEGGR